ncbi:MAG TPA: EamA family transporter [Candidatus Bathyarchaeia archaeon]|nr:EamA family transporter [Candidatus Bathyarchaeia archaeon]
MRSTSYAIPAVIIVVVMWGFSYVAARMVLSTVTPIILATVRFLIASLIFIPIIVREFSRGNFPKARNLLEYAFLGLLGISTYYVLQYTGVKYAGAGISALLVVGLIPVLTGLSSAFLNKEGYGRWQIVGTLLGLLGVTLITLPGLFVDKIDWLFYIGVVCLLLNAVCWAAYSTLSRRLMKKTGKPLITTSYVIVLGALFLLPLSASSDWGSMKYLQPQQWLSILYLAIGCSCVGYFLWNYSLSKMDAVKVTVWVYLEPVVAFVGEALIFATIPTVTTLLGGVAIIAGALVTNWSEILKEVSG